MGGGERGVGGIGEKGVGRGGVTEVTPAAINNKI